MQWVHGCCAEHLIFFRRHSSQARATRLRFCVTAADFECAEGVGPVLVACEA